MRPRKGSNKCKNWICDEQSITKQWESTHYEVNSPGLSGHGYGEELT